MSKLEKKFKEFIKTNYELISSLWITKQLIKDLAKIAEKELPITKEKIIKVLDKYHIEEIDTRPNPVKVTRIKSEQIANEILEEE